MEQYPNKLNFVYSCIDTMNRKLNKVGTKRNKASKSLSSKYLGICYLNNLSP